MKGISKVNICKNEICEEQQQLQSATRLKSRYRAGERFQAHTFVSTRASHFYWTANEWRASPLSSFDPLLMLPPSIPLALQQPHRREGTNRVDGRLVVGQALLARPRFRTLVVQQAARGLRRAGRESRRTLRTKKEGRRVRLSRFRRRLTFRG